MISLGALNPKNRPLTTEQSQNLEELFLVMSHIEAEYGKPLVVTSGFRSVEDETRIDPSHPGSMHTEGAACDILDPDDTSPLWSWIMMNLDLMIELDVYLEDRNSCKAHCHFQIFPPASGKLIFKP